MENQKLTPLMEQYWGIKSKYPEEIVLFRMGDFYEMFHQDAEIAAPILNIALTSRNKKAADQTKMCGVPHHSIAGPIARLLKAGHRVAMCDQIEDPALAKGIVQRAVTRVLTPGMVYDPETLDQVSANYLASFDHQSVAFADVTTGEAFSYDVESEEEREEILALLRPVELVLPAGNWPTAANALVSRLDGEMSCTERLRAYVARLQGDEVAASLRDFERRSVRQFLRLSQTTVAHLELFETARFERAPTLFSCVDRTKTSAGARLLKSWIAFPLLDKNQILDRQSKVDFWMQAPDKTRALRERLAHLGDLERRIGKLRSSTASARDLLMVAESCLIGFEILKLADQDGDQYAPVRELAQRLLQSLQDDPPMGVKDGGMIRRGINPDLDQLIDLSENAQGLLLEFEAREKKQTGISSLKVRYNNVFGYYIELTKLHSEKAPEHYRRKQTLTNAERFTTPELSALEEKILSARSRRADLEFSIYMDLRALVLEQAAPILSFARGLAATDVFAGLAWLAIERDYRRPVLGGDELKLTLSRHPVVEQDRGRNFVPNSIHLGSGKAMLLTGPNMAGKSTLMRQVALTAILAQIGSFVPAESADLPIFTKISSRIGASDSLSEGLSTFMVEMKETAEIVRSADNRSLVIMDEIGRGTSTYDGLSLAQAILEYLVEQRKPYLFFATHYQELTLLARPEILNAHMSVQEKAGHIAFQYRLQAGAANRSYGIHVARLAKLPTEVTRRAESLLKVFERPSANSQLQLQLPLSAEPQRPAEPHAQNMLVDEIKNTDVSLMTPLEAINKINEWQRSLS